MKNLMNEVDCIIWDMDGVLVDVSQSYRLAIKLTAEEITRTDVSFDKISLIKSYVGLNNDWDATYVLSQSILLPDLDIESQIKTLDKSKESKLYKQIKDLFQSKYLGDSLDQRIQNKTNSGLIDTSEELLISKVQLEKFKDKYRKMGIATGRPRDEAIYTLKKNSIYSLFDSIVCLEDTALSKPNPDPILKVIKELGQVNPIYIGDSPSDVIASDKAEIPCIYIGKSNSYEYSTESVNNLSEILL